MKSTCRLTAVVFVITFDVGKKVKEQSDHFDLASGMTHKLTELTIDSHMFE